MTEESPSLSVITLNVNGLNSTIKRQKLAMNKSIIQLHAISRRLTLDPKAQIKSKKMRKDSPCK